MSLILEIITPKARMVEVETTEVTLPGELGELGVLAGHIPLLTSLKSGVLRYQSVKETKAFAIHFGFAEIFNNRVTVLAKEAEAGALIDGAHAQAEVQRLHEALNSCEKSSKEEAKLIQELTKAETRLLASKS
ncbi:MAG: ATP synthase F1 subunit epsilon [Candidatus Lambdaproteobacteria bacterium RIFOXYD12_FULL_49_8]|uniref:ATP synthase epsilon chain n=1 Tax=Candidatus Lambdaproteobacteria bacterium RIFOXYD2_FULL_50_16 TaxID=1817772 RepID=A0A1F6GEE4_9PROT|nr:MAG: ATP synthase F1 subunit epsilon [Candidatus Lambdaproteobacteria bacterium RIFOXYD2_FULL_50_16]OGG97470.1 MAG: ATP synthase F1 subunit epsilon [Candidatus Lambdaproteobacteria bacterium RIFOXYD12_FULL_49_8]